MDTPNEPTAEQKGWNGVINRIEALTSEIKADTALANGREKSLVITKLDEARLWAGEAIEQKFAGIHGGRQG